MHFLNIICLDHIMLPVWMLSGLTLWYLAINGHAHFAKDHFSHSQLPSVAYTSFCEVEASLALRCPVWHIHWCYPCSAYISAVMLARLYTIYSYYPLPQNTLAYHHSILFNPSIPTNLAPKFIHFWFYSVIH